MKGTCDVCKSETEVYPIHYPYVKVFRCELCLMQPGDFHKQPVKETTE
jgi:hypothetical protein